MFERASAAVTDAFAAAAESAGAVMRAASANRLVFLAAVIFFLAFSSNMEWAEPPGAATSLTGRRDSAGPESVAGTASTGPASALALHRDGVKEKLILDLSVSNDKLEEENGRLKLEVVALRRAARECKCRVCGDGNGTAAAAGGGGPAADAPAGA